MPDYVFLSLLSFLIIFSCLAYGSVTTLPLTIIETISALMVVWWLLGMVFKRRLIFVKTGFFLPLLFFLCLIFLQILPLPLSIIRILSASTSHLYETLIPEGAHKAFFSLSIYPYASIGELLRLCAYLGVFFLIINMIKRRQIVFILNMIIIFGSFLSLFGLILRYTKPESSSFGPFVYQNNFASYINMIIPLAIGFCLIDTSFAKKIIYSLAVVIMSAALFMSYSRSGVLVYIIVMLSVLFVSRMRISLKQWFLVLLILILSVLFGFFFIKEVTLWKRLATIFEKKTYVILGHGYPWVDILRIWFNFPVFGIGFGTFGNISPMYKSTFDQSLYIYGHNDLLQFFSETGLIGILLALIFMIEYFNKVLKALIRGGDHFSISLVASGMCSVIGMLFYSLLDFNLHIPANALLFFVIMALTYRLALAHI